MGGERKGDRDNTREESQIDIENTRRDRQTVITKELGAGYIEVTHEEIGRRKITREDEQIYKINT